MTPAPTPPAISDATSRFLATPRRMLIGGEWQDAEVICGDDDPLTPIENARFLADRIRGARLEIVEGAGPLFLWDDIDVTAPLIEQFVNGDAAAGPDFGGAGAIGSSRTVNA